MKNWHLAFWVFSRIWENVVRRDQTFELLPGLAAQWKGVYQMTYIFLRSRGMIFRKQTWLVVPEISATKAVYDTMEGGMSKVEGFDLPWRSQGYHCVCLMSRVG